MSLRARIPGWLEVVLLVAAVFIVGVLVKTFVVAFFFIPSGSMEDTLQIGDRVAVNKFVYHFRDIERGDIVVFDGSGLFTPEVGDEHDFIKRVIGIGGDHVVCCNAAGQITVNGVALDEQSFVYPGNPASLVPFDVRVPDGRLWVMGDHRSASADSRSHLGDPGGGFVPVGRVVGRAMAVIWPLSDAQVLQIPGTFDQPGLN